MIDCLPVEFPNYSSQVIGERLVVPTFIIEPDQISSLEKLLPARGTSRLTMDDE